MSKSETIHYYETQKIGKGLPFVIVDHAELIGNKDLFVPSLRDFHVIFWFKKGTGKYYIDFKEYNIQPNTIALISKDHLHYFAPFDSNCVLQSIVFIPEFIYRKEEDLQHLFSFKANEHLPGKQLLELDDNNTAFFENISNQMKEVYQHWEAPEQSSAFYHLLCLFLLKCGRLQKLNSDKTNHNTGADIQLLYSFHQLLEDHFRSNSAVDFYLEKLTISNKQLAKIIKAKHNKSTKAIIDERRILEIKRLLKGTTKPIKEISYDLSFDEPTNMIKFFKKHVGITPSNFRQE